MLLKLVKDEKNKDIEIVITYPEKNKIVERIVSLIKSAEIQIPCYCEDEAKLINVSDIYYIESVDKKTAVFCENASFQIKDKLYQIYGRLSSAGFVQINKYCILNINKLVKVKTLENSHLEAILLNGSSLYITRKYLAGIKRILQE